MLDKDKVHDYPQRVENYNVLKDKWGEWEILGGEGTGPKIVYIDFRKAVFSGIMKTFTALTAVSFLLTIVLGKILFPALAKMYINQNEELVSLSTLRTAEQVNALSGDKTPAARVKNKKEWF